MNRSMRLTSWAGLVVVLLSLQAAGQEKHDLKLRLQEKETYRMTMVNDQQITQTLQGLELTLKQEVGMGMTYAVSSVDAEGVMSGLLHVEWVTVKMTNPQMSVDYDSRKGTKPTNPAVAGLAAMAGLKVEVAMKPDGSAARVDTEAMTEQMVKNLGVPAGFDESAFRQLVKQQIEGQGLDERLTDFGLFYSDKPVAVGDRWSRTRQLGSALPVQAEETITLSKVADGRGELQMAGKVDGTGEQEVGPGVKSQVTLKGEYGGTATVAMETGWIQKAMLNQDLQGSVEVPGPANGPKITVPMKIRSKVTVEGK